MGPRFFGLLFQFDSPCAKTVLSPFSIWYLRKSHSQAGLATCAFHFMCLVTLVCFITYQWIHNRRTSVCTVAISLVTATTASQKTLELPLLIYKLFTMIGQLGLSVKVTLLHQNTQSYNMCSILPLQQMKMYSKSLQFKIRIQLSDLSSSFWSSY